ncbi:MAG: hypothetical protein NTZ25_02115 [Candidatus Peregrinibacteria bacterium]|nr:hypothetical protein [Candidatus Peregrinibacteria bacterium]
MNSPEGRKRESDPGIFRDWKMKLGGAAILASLAVLEAGIQVVNRDYTKTVEGRNNATGRLALEESEGLITGVKDKVAVCVEGVRQCKKRARTAEESSNPLSEFAEKVSKKVVYPVAALTCEQRNLDCLNKIDNGGISQ